MYYDSLYYDWSSWSMLAQHCGGHHNNPTNGANTELVTPTECYSVREDEPWNIKNRFGDFSIPVEHGVFKGCNALNILWFTWHSHSGVSMTVTDVGQWFSARLCPTSVMAWAGRRISGFLQRYAPAIIPTKIIRNIWLLPLLHYHYLPGWGYRCDYLRHT